MRSSKIASEVNSSRDISTLMKCWPLRPMGYLYATLFSGIFLLRR